MSMSASGLVGRTFDVGPYEREEIHLIEVDAQGRRRWGEVFAVNHLGDAVARLYERYAELLPNGPARTRAAAIARSVVVMLRPFDDRYAEALAPGIESVDHRLLGTWSARGAEEVLRHWRSFVDLINDLAVRYGDILAVQPDAFLVSAIFYGTDRASGGAYEVPFLRLFAFGAAGLVTRGEAFDPPPAAEALPPLHGVTPERGPPPPAQRRGRPNPAPRSSARPDAA